MKQEVMYLASDNLKGRETGTTTEKMSADFIISKFLEYDLIEKGTEGYYQYFETSVREHPHSNNRKKINGINVVGYIDNNTNETVVIGAHYDHLGYGKFGSLYSGEHTIHNGADDNASGVSILINLIPFLKQITDYNFLFIAFSGEEHGLLGSSYYVKNPTINLETVRYMLNFDMVGRLNKDEKLVINGIGTSPQWKELLNKSNTLYIYSSLLPGVQLHPVNPPAFNACTVLKISLLFLPVSNALTEACCTVPYGSKIKVALKQTPSIETTPHS